MKRNGQQRKQWRVEAVSRFPEHLELRNTHGSSGLAYVGLAIVAVCVLFIIAAVVSIFRPDPAGEDIGVGVRILVALFLTAVIALPLGAWGFYRGTATALRVELGDEITVHRVLSIETFPWLEIEKIVFDTIGGKSMRHPNGMGGIEERRMTFVLRDRPLWKRFIWIKTGQQEYEARFVTLIHKAPIEVYNSLNERIHADHRESGWLEELDEIARRC